MKNIIKNRNFIKKLLLCSNKNLLIKKANKSEIESICEIIYNILINNCRITLKQFLNLKSQKNQLRSLVKKNKISAKKKILQTGGFLNILVPAIFTGLSFIVEAFKK